MRRGVWLIVVGILASACGGSSGSSTSNISASAGDLSATLTLRPASLPDGVSATEIGLSMLVDENAETGAPVLALRLLPDGLVLDEPASLTIELPEPLLNGAFVAMLMSGDSVEFLEGEIEFVDGVSSFTTSIEHFSVLSLHALSEALFSASLSVEPTRVNELERHEATAVVTMSTVDQVPLWMRFNQDSGAFRLMTFSSPLGLPRVESATLQYHSLGDAWDPDRQAIDLIETASGWKSSPNSPLIATCLADSDELPRFEDAEFVTILRFRLVLLERGEPTDQSFIGFTGPYDVEDFADIRSLLTVPLGETISVRVYVVADAPARCDRSEGVGDGSESEVPDEGGTDVAVGDAAQGSTPCPDATATDAGDPRAQPASVAGVTDSSGELWYQIRFCGRWGQLPPDLFSFLWWMISTFNPTTEIGWEIHDGVVTVLGTMSQAYILDDGTVLVATGLFPTGDYEVTIDSSFGSWVTEDGPPAVFGDTSFVLDGDSIPVADPFEYFDADPVYDLITGN